MMEFITGEGAKVERRDRSESNNQKTRGKYDNHTSRTQSSSPSKGSPTRKKRQQKYQCCWNEEVKCD